MNILINDIHTNRVIHQWGFDFNIIFVFLFLRMFDAMRSIALNNDMIKEHTLFVERVIFFTFFLYFETQVSIFSFFV